MISRMIVGILMFAGALGAQDGCQPPAPCYSAENIVNSASYQSGWLAPYTFATIWGSNLNRLGDPPYERQHGDDDCAIAGVAVLVNGISAMVLYVSANQVNFIVPMSAAPGEVTVELHRDGSRGPQVRLALNDWSPTLFLQPDAAWVAALHPTTGWTLITEQSPVRPGEYAILYATGLGDAIVPLDDYEPPGAAMPIRERNRFRLLLDGEAVEDGRVEYVGMVPGWYGLYQINLRVPAQSGRNPEVRIAIGDRVSPVGPRLAVRPDQP
jgi:uncharacterized protein (TIGR03437 family)